MVVEYYIIFLKPYLWLNGRMLGRLSLHCLQYVCASCQGCGETVRVRKLITVLAAHTCNKYKNCMYWPYYLFYSQGHSTSLDNDRVS